MNKVLGFIALAFAIIRKTPFGNSLTIDLAKAAVDGEQLGADDEPTCWQ